jgi:hypothetical protein
VDSKNILTRSALVSSINSMNLLAMVPQEVRRRVGRVWGLWGASGPSWDEESWDEESCWVHGLMMWAGFNCSPGHSVQERCYARGGRCLSDA